MAKRWKSWWVLDDDDDGADGDDDNNDDGAGDGVLWEMAFPIALMMVTVSSARPPRVSVTTGTNSTPTALQAARWTASLRWTPTLSAWPGVRDASRRVCCCRGEMTYTSRAAGRPLLQVGSEMSAGLESESGTTPAASREGARAADWAAENRTSRMALWHVILSLLPPQPTWWSPYSSASVPALRAGIWAAVERDAKPVSQVAAEFPVL